MTSAERKAAQRRRRDAGLTQFTIEVSRKVLRNAAIDGGWLLHTDGPEALDRALCGVIEAALLQACAGGMAIPLSSTVLAALMRPAITRGTSVLELAGSVLENVAAKGLVDAVLTDELSTGPRHGVTGQVCSSGSGSRTVRS